MKSKLFLGALLLATVIVVMKEASFQEKLEPAVEAWEVDRYGQLAPAPEVSPSQIEPSELKRVEIVIREKSVADRGPASETYAPTREDEEILAKLMALKKSMDLEKEFLGKTLRVSNEQYEEIGQQRKKVMAQLQEAQEWAKTYRNDPTDVRLAVLSNHVNWMRNSVGSANYGRVQEILDLGDEELQP